MALFRYPANDFDDSEKLLHLLGSFWATSYGGNGLLEDLVTAVGQAAQQSHRQLMELVRSVSRFTVPIYHQDNWYALRIRESELNTSSQLQARYTDPTSLTYQASPDRSYGDLEVTPFYAVEKPTGLQDVKVIFNRLAAPSVELFDRLDYWLQDELIVFRQNPFDNALIPQQEILNRQGEITDREITLWVYRGQWDWNTIYQQFGYALQLQLDSSEGYRDFLNAIFDSFVEGTSERTQRAALAAAFGVPLVIEAQETVETIQEDADALNVITDQHVYRFPLDTTALVSEGETVTAGQSLTTLFQVFEFGRGETIDSEDLSALAIGSGMLAWGFWGDLTFANEDVSLEVEEGVDGYTKVSWELGGFPFDVEKFWEDVHEAGVATDQTLAMLLDVREEPNGQPTAASLPATINPLQFLADNLLRNHAYVLKVRPGSELPGGLAYVPIEQLRKIQPPHTLMMLIVELVYADSPVIMEAPGTETDPGYEESVSGFPCMETTDTIDASSFVTETVRLKKIGGRCI